jgi:hypothetical protein
MVTSLYSGDFNLYSGDWLVQWWLTCAVVTLPFTVVTNLYSGDYNLYSGGFSLYNADYNLYSGGYNL